jgi:hypothetical protein
MSREPKNVDMLEDIDSKILRGTVREFWVNRGMFHRAKELFFKFSNRGMDMTKDKFMSIMYHFFVDYLVKGRKTNAPEDTPRPSRWWEKTI